MQIVLATEDGFIEATGHKFVVVDLSVVVHVDGVQQILNIGQWDFVYSLILEVLPKLLI